MNSYYVILSYVMLITCDIDFGLLHNFIVFFLIPIMSVSSEQDLTCIWTKIKDNRLFVKFNKCMGVSQNLNLR